MYKKLFVVLLGLSLLFAACKDLTNLSNQNDDDGKKEISDYFEFLEQPKVLSDVLIYEKNPENVPSMSVTVNVKKTGKVSFEWYKKSSSDEDILIRKCDEFLVDNLSCGSYSDEFTVSLDDFSGNYLVENSYYCKVLFDDGNEPLSSTSNLCSVKSSLPETGLKTFYLTTETGEYPPCEYMYEKCGKYVTVGQEKIPGTLVIKQNGSVLYDSGEYEKKKSGITLKIRGNGSAYDAKKPFKIKLQKKEDLLFRGDKKYKDKNWNLLGKAHFINTAFGLTVSDIVYDSWTPKFEYVNVVLNNEFLGLYILVESIEENSDCRIDVSDNGFCVERDAYVELENMFEKPENIAKTFKTNLNYYVYSFVYPDDDDSNDNDIAVIKACIDKLEESISDGTYDEVLDVKSWASWVLVHDIVGQKDINGANKYVSKYSNSDTDLLKMETTWDFDQIFNNPNKWVTIHDEDTAFYFADLFKSSNKKFVEAYKDLWKEVGPTLEQNINSWYDSFSLQYGKSLDASFELDKIRWNINYLPTVEKCRKTINNWIRERIPFIDSNIDNL